MASFLDGTGLGHLIEKIKAAFIAKTDTTIATSIGIDSTPTTNSTNLVTSGGVKSALDNKANSSDLSTVATTGSYNDLSNKPTIPTLVKSDWNESDSTSYAYIQNKPNITQDGIGDMIINGHNIDIQTSDSVNISGAGFGINTSDLLLNGEGGTIDFAYGSDDDKLKIYGGQGVFIEGANNKNIKLTTIGNGKAYYNDKEIATVDKIPSLVQSNWNETDTSSDAYILNKPTIPDITGKADKVSSAVEGNFASLDSNGNLEDSGYSYTDCLNELSDQYTPATESSELEPGDTFEEAFGKLEKTITDNEYVTAQALNDLNTNKQDTLESGINIKTINGESILGDGNFNVTGDCIAYPSFEIDSNGHLIMSGGQQGLFTLENGHLMYNF